MMFRNRTLGVDVMINAPDTPEELDQMVGQRGATMQAALRYYAYHAFNPKFRPALAKALVEKTGIPVPQKVVRGEPEFEEVKNEDGTTTQVPVLVTEQVYINGLLAQGAISETEYAELAQEVADTIEFRPGESSGKAKKPLAKHYDYADRYLAQVQAGTKTPEQFIETFEALNGVPFASLGEGFTRETLATALRINEERKAKLVGSDFE